MEFPAVRTRFPPLASTGTDRHVLIDWQCTYIISYVRVACKICKLRSVLQMLTWNRLDMFLFRRRQSIHSEYLPSFLPSSRGEVAVVRSLVESGIRLPLPPSFLPSLRPFLLPSLDFIVGPVRIVNQHWFDCAEQPARLPCQSIHSRSMILFFQGYHIISTDATHFLMIRRSFADCGGAM